ncbi:11188_t:CDS:1, partial [Funneliformis geosporum]
MAFSDNNILEEMDEKLDEILASLRSPERRIRSIENQNEDNISMNKKLAK